MNATVTKRIRNLNLKVVIINLEMQKCMINRNAYWIFVANCKNNLKSKTKSGWSLIGVIFFFSDSYCLHSSRLALITFEPWYYSHLDAFCAPQKYVRLGDILKISAIINLSYVLSPKKIKLLEVFVSYIQSVNK